MRNTFSCVAMRHKDRKQLSRQHSASVNFSKSIQHIGIGSIFSANYLRLFILSMKLNFINCNICLFDRVHDDGEAFIAR